MMWQSEKFGVHHIFDDSLSQQISFKKMYNGTKKLRKGGPSKLKHQLSHKRTKLTSFGLVTPQVDL